MNGFVPLHSVWVIVALFVGTLALAAQPTRPDAENRPGGDAQGRPMADRPAFRPGGGMGAQYLPQLERVLTDEQLLSLRKAVEGQRTQRQELEKKLGDARSALWQASVIETFDEATVRAKAMEVAKVEAELIVLRAKAFAEILPALSAEQIEKLRQAGPQKGGERFRSLLPQREPRKPREGNSPP